WRTNRTLWWYLKLAWITASAVNLNHLYQTIGALRLVDGQHRCEGRVELYLNSTWGTVCDDAWDLRDAQVVCRLVSCGEATHAWGEAHFGPGTGTILLDNLKCSGTEASLQQCLHKTPGFILRLNHTLHDT
uniref:SRCR domain-containing protein n=1 Tax=Poecilia reticulata TaxID=8081 RepID=A0A3P9NQU3_POERE